MQRSPTALLAMLVLAACSASLPETASLPRDAVDGVGDPTRAAILGSAYAFAEPGRLAGQRCKRADEAARLRLANDRIAEQGHDGGCVGRSWRGGRITPLPRADHLLTVSSSCLIFAHEKIYFLP
jgi:hypothetical protein